jgi:hypothetical protein
MTKGLLYRALNYTHSQFSQDVIAIGVIFYTPDGSNHIRFIKAKSLSRLNHLYNISEGGFLASYFQAIQSSIDEINWYLDNHSLFNNVEELERLIQERVLGLNSGAISFSGARFIASDNFEKSIEFISNQLLGHYDSKKSEKERKDDTYLRKLFHDKLQRISPQQRDKVKDKYKVPTHTIDIEFDFAWKNGKVNGVSALGFDYKDKSSIDGKAHKWYGVLSHLEKIHSDITPNFILSPPLRIYRKEYDNALGLLTEVNTAPRFIKLNQIDDYIDEIAAKASSF